MKAVSVDGYTSTVDGYDVTNKHTSGTGDSGSTGTFTGTRKIVFYAPDRVSYQIKDGWHIIDNATLNFDVNETVYFKPITSYGNFNTLVYVNEKLVEPGEDGWYAIEPGTLPVLVSVAPGFTDEETGKSTSVWDQLINFVKQIINAIINLFKKG